MIIPIGSRIAATLRNGERYCGILTQVEFGRCQECLKRASIMIDQEYHEAIDFDFVLLALDAIRHLSLLREPLCPIWTPRQRIPSGSMIRVWRKHSKQAMEGTLHNICLETINGVPFASFELRTKDLDASELGERINSNQIRDLEFIGFEYK